MIDCIVYSDPDIGVNISMVNCLTKDTANTYYHSFASEKETE